MTPADSDGCQDDEVRRRIKDKDHHTGRDRALPADAGAEMHVRRARLGRRVLEARNLPRLQRVRAAEHTAGIGIEAGALGEHYGSARAGPVS